MKQFHKLLLLMPLLAVLAASTLFAAGEGRLQGTVVDQDGNPVEGVKVTITQSEVPTFKEERTTKDDGTFTILFAKGFLPYDYFFEAEGFRPHEETVKTRLAGLTRHTFTLTPGSASSGVTASGEKAASESNKAIFAYNDGVELFKLGQYADAEVKFLEAVTEDPGFHEAHSALAGNYFERGNYQAAVASAETARGINPGYLNTMQVLYKSYNELGEKTKANEVQQQLAEMGEAAEEAKAIFNEAVGLNNDGDKDGALAKFQQAVSMDPSLVDGWKAVATLAYQKEDWNLASTGAEKLLELVPSDEAGLNIRYEAYRALGDSEKLVGALIDLAQVNPDFAGQNLMNLGVSYYNNGDLENAGKLFKTALDANPGELKIHYYLGLCEINAGNSESAKQHLQAFVDGAQAGDPDLDVAKSMLAYL
ncbi:MAG: tetratricopeptide repeat protein [Acidobacteriota bacterium]